MPASELFHDWSIELVDLMKKDSAKRNYRLFVTKNLSSWYRASAISSDSLNSSGDAKFIEI